jgi:Tol biopolymer transport system component
LIYEPRDERRRISHECATDGPFVYVRATTAVLSQTTALPDAVMRIDLSGADQREVFRAPQGQRILSDIVAVSPDGRMLSVVTSLDRNRRLLMVMPSDGGTPRQVVEFRQPSVRGMAHTWVSDGRSILYVHGPENGISSIRRVRIDGEATEPETVFQSNQALRGLRFQPSGRLLAFTGFPGSPSSSEVWTIESLREQLARLAAPPTRKAP